MVWDQPCHCALAPPSDILGGMSSAARAVCLTRSPALRKTLRCHWADMVVLGGLQVGGYVDVLTADARGMASRETRVLAALGVPDGEVFVVEEE